MSLTRIYQRLKPRLRQLLQAQTWDLDFGLFRNLNRRRPEIERYLDDELPQSVAARTNGVLQAGDVYAALSQFADEAAGAVMPLHVHCTSPLPEYAFRLPSGRRVVFERSRT